MNTVIDGIQVLPYEINVNVANEQHRDTYYSEYAVEILNRCVKSDIKKIYFINFVSESRMKTSYRVIGMEYIAPCQIGHCRLYNGYGTALQSHDYRQQVALEWHDQLNKDKACIEDLTNENKTDVQNMLKVYVKHVPSEQKSQFIEYLLDTSDLAILKEVGLAFIRFLRYAVTIE
ncbi:hypothetical protein [Alicyclobacillus sp. SP_1]|uniref:hypothetical protein n=1 Tax=Alicyclobacillus sp. SP_1 TaxID=2942475 RepID=UPI002157CACC|nr:hypothetical protein [Alicyclobacillus sp. SP_1]